MAADMVSPPATEQSGFAQRTRLASESAPWGTALILVVSAALPMTDPNSRPGLLFTVGLLLVFAANWFHLLPEPVFGRMRFVVGTAVSPISARMLLVLTGDVGSPYFAFYFFPIL